MRKYRNVRNAEETSFQSTTRLQFSNVDLLSKKPPKSRNGKKLETPELEKVVLSHRRTSSLSAGVA
jgi:hypothetical protein